MRATPPVCLLPSHQPAPLPPTGEAPVSDPCRAELVEFKMDRASNVNKDLALAMACRRDIRRYCRPKLDGADPAAILDCLREKRQKVGWPLLHAALGLHSGPSPVACAVAWREQGSAGPAGYSLVPGH